MRPEPESPSQWYELMSTRPHFCSKLTVAGYVWPPTWDDIHTFGVMVMGFPVGSTPGCGVTFWIRDQLASRVTLPLPIAVMTWTAHPTIRLKRWISVWLWGCENVPWGPP